VRFPFVVVRLLLHPASLPIHTSTSKLLQINCRAYTLGIPANGYALCLIVIIAFMHLHLVKKRKSLAATKIHHAHVLSPRSCGSLVSVSIVFPSFQFCFGFGFCPPHLVCSVHLSVFFQHIFWIYHPSHTNTICHTLYNIA